MASSGGLVASSHRHAQEEAWQRYILRTAARDDDAPLEVLCRPCADRGPKAEEQATPRKRTTRGLVEAAVLKELASSLTSPVKDARIAAHRIFDTAAERVARAKVKDNGRPASVEQQVSRVRRRIKDKIAPGVNLAVEVIPRENAGRTPGLANFDGGELCVPRAGLRPRDGDMAPAPAGGR